MGIRTKIARSVVPDVHRVAPTLNTGFVHRTVRLAIAGAGPLPAAAVAAERHLDQEGRLDKAVDAVIKNHTRLAGAQGLLTNLGGLVTAAATIPANLAGLALVQCRMVAGIAHLHGYDLDDARVRNAILLCTLGEEPVKGLVKRQKLAGPPMLVATAPTHDPSLDTTVAGEVTSALISRVVGKRAAGTIVRRVPLAGGVWSGSADAYATWQVGRYAARELRPRSDGPRLPSAR